MWMIILAGLGLWFLLEGVMYAAAPDAMKRFGEFLSDLPEQAIRQAGILSMLFGGLLLYAVVRFGSLG